MYCKVIHLTARVVELVRSVQEGIGREDEDNLYTVLYTTACDTPTEEGKGREGKEEPYTRTALQFCIGRDFVRFINNLQHPMRRERTHVPGPLR